MYDNNNLLTPKEPTPYDHLGLKLIIPLEAYKKIIAYAQLAENLEITGFADVAYDKATHHFTVGEVYLMKQNAGGADVHIEEEDLSEFNLEMIRKGKTQLPQLWWHSHVDMQAFFSGTDEGTLKDLQNETYIIALVVNKRGELKAKMYIRTKTKMIVENPLIGKETEEVDEQIEIDPLPVQVQLTKTDIPQTLRTEVKNKLQSNMSRLPYKNPFKGIFGKEKEEKKGDRRSKKAKETKDDQHADWAAEYTDDPTVRVYRLPKDEEKAKDKIKELGLVKRYNYLSKEMVWRDPNDDGVIYVDYWEVVQFYYPEHDRAIPPTQFEGN